MLKYRNRSLQQTLLQDITDKTIYCHYIKNKYLHIKIMKNCRKLVYSINLKNLLKRLPNESRKTCSIFKLKNGGVYNASKFAQQERGLTDAQLARSMRTSAREIQSEESRALRLAREEDRREADRGAVSVGVCLDDSD